MYSTKGPASGGSERPQRPYSDGGERGQTIVLMMMLLLAILGFMAIAIDVGSGFAGKSKVQRAADAAAFSAAQAHLLAGISDTEAKAVAMDWAAKNGYAADNSEITVNIPPKSGPHAGDDFYVEVIIETEQETNFTSLFGIDWWDITARAVATSDTEAKDYAIITLNSNSCKATNIDGSVTIVIEDAGTFTRSNCPENAFHSQGSIIVDTQENDVVGGWQAGGDVDPQPTKAYPIIDPLAELEPPNPPAGPVNPCPTYGGAAGVVTLSPGVYDCKINPPGGWSIEFLPGDYLITGGLVVDGNGNVTFGSGTYTFQGSGLLLTGTGDISGDGVTFYVEEGETKLIGTGDATLNAPTEGDYKGVLVFQARDNDNTVYITGNAASGGWGTVYASAAQVDFSGNGTTSFQFISDTFWAHGNSSANIIYKDNFPAHVPFVWITE